MINKDFIVLLCMHDGHKKGHWELLSRSALDRSEMSLLAVWGGVLGNSRSKYWESLGCSSALKKPHLLVNSTRSSLCPWQKRARSRLYTLPACRELLQSEFLLSSLSLWALPLTPWVYCTRLLCLPLYPYLVLRSRDTETLIPSLQSLVQSEVLSCVDGISQWSLELALDPSGGASVSAAWNLEILFELKYKGTLTYTSRLYAWSTVKSYEIGAYFELTSLHLSCVHNQELSNLITCVGTSSPVVEWTVIFASCKELCIWEEEGRKGQRGWKDGTGFS